ncbi:MAG: hypothetical protein DMG91_17390 [Acidobacteria bacterium]|nr:MAG: hypothetical protein DMG91_17390 [Acidobacteriota bacterium]
MGRLWHAPGVSLADDLPKLYSVSVRILIRESISRVFAPPAMESIKLNESLRFADFELNTQTYRLSRCGMTQNSPALFKRLPVAGIAS